MVCIFQYKPGVTKISYLWIRMRLQGVKVSNSTHARSSSTMINTPWHAKINAQHCFYFVILPVGVCVCGGGGGGGGGGLIDHAVWIKRGLELYSDAHETLIFDKYEECTPKNHERTRHVEVRINGYNIKLQMVLFRWEVKNKNKRGLSAFASSPSLDEWIAVENQSNDMYLISWSRLHNTVLCYCIRETLRIVAIWIFVCLLAYWVYKITMANRGEVSCTSNLHARTSLSCALVC